ncbi:unnamed protein product [Rotaria socialis]|uniref:NHL repeat containing protein n=1 Tax=Rotaria socialis TaxID=392032 RepID=A0A820D6Z6_9BILA|nr:unnamed protein product [Rotaria socialis]
MGLILLPIMASSSNKADEQCTTKFTETTTILKIWVDRLCAANATWNSQGVTVAGSSVGENSLSSSHINSPNDLLINISGNLFIADFGNNRVVYWPVNGTEGRMIAGKAIIVSWSNLLRQPAALAIWKNQLYVSDLSNYRILAFPLSTNEGSPDGIAIVCHYSAGASLNQIDSVYYMSIDKTRQLFYLSGFRNNRILKLNITDNTVNTVIGIEGSDSEHGSINLPLGITVDEKNGSLYVVDSLNNGVLKFDFNSIQEIIVTGDTGSGSNFSQLDSPSGVAWPVQAQQGRAIAGSGTPGITSSQLNYPLQLKFDIHYNLYVVDRNNNRIQRFDLLNNGC